MLERASTCLESGGRQLFRPSLQCLRSRRMLHSHFWHHGASDLSLPIWWAAASALGSLGGDADGRQETTASAATSRRHHGVLLDFLYPEKTLALIRRLSVNASDGPESRRKLAGVRRFSTQDRPWHEDSKTDEGEIRGAKSEMDKLLRNSTAAVELEKLLRERAPGKQELAWQLYSALPKFESVDDLARFQRGVLEYLVQDGSPAVPGRVLKIFNTLPASHRRSSSYRAAITAYIALRMVGPAMKLQDDITASDDIDTLHVGIDAILARTVGDEQWDLSFRVFRTFLRQTPTLQGLPTKRQIRFGEHLPELWSKAAHVPTLLENLQSFFQYVREFQHELRASPESEETLSCFVMSFVPNIIKHVLETPTYDEPFILRWFDTLFDELHSLLLPTAACYDYAIKQMLELPRYQTYTYKRPIWRHLYQRYRDASLKQMANENEKPSQSLIRQIIFFYGKKDKNLVQLDERVQDHRTFYPGTPMRPGLLKFLMTVYANAGEATQVCEYFDELQKNHKEHVTLKTVTSFLFVYARRADVDETMAQFRRIRDEFGLVPDLTCWNIVLLAYVRADDLEGALECFNDCVDSGIVPDEYTFGPLLDFCAARGDVEAFESLFSRGKQMRVPLDSNIRCRSGYVQAFLNAGDAEGAEAIALGILKGWQAGTLHGWPLTHTWNLLIQHHALERDLANCRRLYKQMVENNIPLDSWTFSSLMRALIEVKQSNAAYKILRRTMPDNNLRVHALHYAIVMTGFLRERQLFLAQNVYERMIRHKVPQTESSREASLLTLGALDPKKLKERNTQHPNFHLVQVEEALEEMLVAATGKEIAHREARHSKQSSPRNYGAIPQAYYSLMISLFTSRGAHAVCEKLAKRAEEATPDSKDFTVSITLSTAMMEHHLKNHRYDEVAKHWAIAHKSAVKLSKTFHQVMNPEPIVPEFDSLVDPSIRQRFEQAHISNNRRQILVRATRLYLRSLLAQPVPNALLEAQRTIRDLLVHGFIIDTFVWNEFIVGLAQRNRIADAFTICEEYLMPRFPGWRSLHPNYRRHDPKGYQWMELRTRDVTKTTMLPRYKTLVILARAYRQTKEDERNGVGYDASEGMWVREILEKEAPLTVRAIETMPRTKDRMQMKYLLSVP